MVKHNRVEYNTDDQTLSGTTPEKRTRPYIYRSATISAITASSSQHSGPSHNTFDQRVKRLIWDVWSTYNRAWLNGTRGNSFCSNGNTTIYTHLQSAPGLLPECASEIMPSVFFWTQMALFTWVLYFVASSSTINADLLIHHAYRRSSRDRLIRATMLVQNNVKAPRQRGPGTVLVELIPRSGGSNFHQFKSVKIGIFSIDSKMK